MPDGSLSVVNQFDAETTRLIAGFIDSKLNGSIGAAADLIAGVLKPYKGEHDKVPAQLIRWIWAGGQQLKGLVKCREAEAFLYTYRSSNKNMRTG